MEKFENLLSFIESPVSGLKDPYLATLQQKVIACRSEFLIENKAKNDAIAKYTALLDLSKLMFESFASRVNLG